MATLATRPAILTSDAIREIMSFVEEYPNMIPISWGCNAWISIFTCKNVTLNFSPCSVVVYHDVAFLFSLFEKSDSFANRFEMAGMKEMDGLKQIFVANSVPVLLTCEKSFWSVSCFVSFQFSRSHTFFTKRTNDSLEHSQFIQDEKEYQYTTKTAGGTESPVRPQCSMEAMEKMFM